MNVRRATIWVSQDHSGTHRSNISGDEDGTELMHKEIDTTRRNFFTVVPVVKGISGALVPAPPTTSDEAPSLGRPIW